MDGRVTKREKGASRNNQVFMNFTNVQLKNEQETLKI